MYKRQQESWDKVLNRMAVILSSIEYLLLVLSFSDHITPIFPGLENPLPPVAAGNPAGQRACHRAASQVLQSPKFGLQTLLSFNSPTC